MRYVVILLTALILCLFPQTSQAQAYDYMITVPIPVSGTHTVTSLSQGVFMRYLFVVNADSNKCDISQASFSCLLEIPEYNTGSYIIVVYNFVFNDGTNYIDIYIDGVYFDRFYHKHINEYGYRHRSLIPLIGT